MSIEYLQQELGMSTNNMPLTLLLEIVSSKIDEVVINRSSIGQREIIVSMGLKKAAAKYINNSYREK